MRMCQGVDAAVCGSVSVWGQSRSDRGRGSQRCAHGHGNQRRCAHARVRRHS